MSPPRSVVIADPEPGERARLRELVERAATELGLTLAIHEASDGATALQRIDSQAPLLVLAEILLPELSGLQLLRRLREGGDRERPPVILVTTMGRESDRYWGLRNGAHAYVIKPYESELLLNRIRQVLDPGGKAEQEQLGLIELL